MLKNLFSRITRLAGCGHRNKKTYTVVVDHPARSDSGHSVADLEDTMQFHVINMQRVISRLGYRATGLTVALKREHVSARAVMYLDNDETAARVLTLIDDSMCEHTTTRIVSGVKTRELHDHPLEPVGHEAL
jgi:hypothetical protein